ncbi:TetR family transcriptional regulator [Tamilnaduibacter salinus]|uniref:TetR family transcriptional regulator n=1 Tax=Tamilnaduibacter salinus TaxID=1484056 RepID=A0A2A2I3F8_9GAMM|nr:TetR/AcrR family transcriptional regulator [Tamilnaduibacter salinus]PAV26122.1 TetR family transcriptional regulator [Tamilnaduibacter salinus]PVY77370.1 TetR family transcriptional regulator [Tamilnaduibacter salinus]
MPRAARYDRNQAIERAVRLFWERGYAGSSMKQIEQALDMRPGSLYATFGSKDGLFHEALDHYAGQMSAALDEQLAAGETPLEGLKRYLREAGRQLLAPKTPARACMMVKTLLEANRDQPMIRDRVNELLARTEARFADILQASVRSGELPAGTDCQRLARLLQAQIMGLRSFAQRDVPASTITELVEDMIAILDSYRSLS